MKRPPTGKKNLGITRSVTKIVASNAGNRASSARQPPDEKRVLKQTKLEFNVAKAKEFETFKQIPKFSKPKLSVIHPPALYAKPDPGHKAPKSMVSDGNEFKLNARRYGM